MSRLSRRRLGLGALALAGCAKTRSDSRLEESSIRGEESTTLEEGTTRLDLPYLASNHPKHRLDAYLPARPSPPAVIFLHGGYWVSGDRRAPEHGAGLYGSLGEALARRGVAAIIPSYRLAPEVAIEAMVEDVKAALAWVMHGLAIDRARLFLVGHSAGGHLAALVAAEARIAGVGVLSGIWDVADMRAKQPQSFNRAVTTPVFGAGDRDRAFSPSLEGPHRWLVLVAEHDFSYMIPQAERAHRRLRELGRDAGLVVVPGYDHLDVVRRFGAPGDPVVDHVVALAGKTTSSSG